MAARNTGFGEKPTIKLFYDSRNFSVADFFDVLLGIEEEGIPYDFQPKDTSDVLELASEASKSSRVGVGIGISKEGIVLQYEKLEKEAPLFRIKIYQTDLYRKIGSNAARLVKKMPFKSLD
jgi:hypothetical protein